MTSLNRREFIASATGAMALAAGQNSLGEALSDDAVPEFEGIAIPKWVHEVTRMSFLAPDAVPDVAKIGVQVVHGNSVWPYFPLRKDGGKLTDREHADLKRFADETHRHGMRLVLGLPPFPSADCMRAHPEWRIASDQSGSQLRIEPDEKNLGTRLACNQGPWGDYLIELCAELMQDYGLDGYSFDGNYHPPICYCGACRLAYQQERQRTLPEKVNLDDIAYREYLVWRGEKLEQHYAGLQRRLKGIKSDAVVMTWTVNAGRYGHFLHSPRAMPTRMNLLIDLPMQEWWLDETNIGASVAPSFGAEYLAAVTGYRPCGCEPYLMSRGNPYSPDSFPPHERLLRSMLVLTHGSTTAHSVGWPGGVAAAAPVFAETKRREGWLTHCRPLPWAAILVSEQSRQFYAYRDIADRFLPHVFGAYRVGLEEHWPVSLLNDWDVTAGNLAKYRVVILPNAAALSDQQVAALRDYVASGGGLVATTETSLCDELGRPRRDFALSDVFGVSYRGRPSDVVSKPGAAEIDANFAIALDDNYWKQRVGSTSVTWAQHELVQSDALNQLVPGRQARFKGPQVLVSEPKAATEVAVRLLPDGSSGVPAPGVSLPGVIVREFGQGRVVYFAAAFDASLWNYAYPYQRHIFARAVTWCAKESPSIRVTAPRCVQTTFYDRHAPAAEGRAEQKQLVIHFFNNVNTTAALGNPANEVPLREESIPVHGLRISFSSKTPSRVHLEPGGILPKATSANGETVIDLPPLDVHYMLIGEWT